jgi:hypothetical protein
MNVRTLVAIMLIGVCGTASSQQYLGNYSANPYASQSSSNQYGSGSPYDPNSINNPYGQYGSPYSNKDRRLG